MMAAPLTGMEAILAIELPEEVTTIRRSRRITWTMRAADQPAADDVWRRLTRAYLRGELIEGGVYTYSDLVFDRMRTSGVDMFAVQMSLAEHRSPLKLRTVRGGFRVESR